MTMTRRTPIDRATMVRTCHVLTAAVFAACAAGDLQAADSGVASNPYMGAPVELVKVPNGAIASKNPFDRYRPERAIAIPPAVLEHAR
jgi:hypothetical protein